MYASESFYGGVSHRRRLNDGNSFNNLLLVQLGTGSVEITDDGGHARLVA
jgi:hypothetical protein